MMNTQILAHNVHLIPSVTIQIVNVQMVDTLMGNIAFIAHTTKPKHIQIVHVKKTQHLLKIPTNALIVRATGMC